MLAEFVFRAVTAGFYGAATQRFRQIEPAWRDEVVGHLMILLANADLVVGLELPDETEPAPVYEVLRDGN